MSIGDVKTGRSAVIDRMVPRTGAIYSLCGRAPRCALHGGALTAKELAYIEAEGLETALHTLHAQPVREGRARAAAGGSEHRAELGMYIRPAWQKQLLAQPLSKTLGWGTPPPAGSLSDDDVKRISALTVALHVQAALGPAARRERRADAHPAAAVSGRAVPPSSSAQ